MFETVFGHQRIKNLLTRMVENDHLHHGLCFHGPAGIGKRLMAQKLARAMLCEQRKGCGSCNHCHKFDSGNHPDYQEIAPVGADIKVDQIRDIAENLHFRPFEARCRFIVLDQVERFRDEAANAFLKSLEEPPDYVYFVLVATDVKALLPTIRSRCQQVSFQSLTEQDKTQILTNRFSKDEAMAKRLAGISFRRLETEDEAWTNFRKDTKLVLEYFNLMLQQGSAIDHLSDILWDKANKERFADHLIAATREITLVSRGCSPNHHYEEFAENIKQLADSVAPPYWRDIWERMTRLQGARRLHLNQPLWFNAESVTGLGLMARERNQVKARLQQR